MIYLLLILLFFAPPLLSMKPLSVEDKVVPLSKVMPKPSPRRESSPRDRLAMAHWETLQKTEEKRQKAEEERREKARKELADVQVEGVEGDNKRTIDFLNEVIGVGDFDDLHAVLSLFKEKNIDRNNQCIYSIIARHGGDFRKCQGLIQVVILNGIDLRKKYKEDKTLKEALAKLDPGGTWNGFLQEQAMRLS